MHGAGPGQISGTNVNSSTDTTDNDDLEMYSADINNNHNDTLQLSNITLHSSML